MATLYSQQSRNIRLTWTYITGFLVFVMVVGYFFSLALNSSTVLYICFIFSVVMSFTSYWWSDRIVLTMSGAKELTHDNGPASTSSSLGGREIYHLVENLCITAGLPAPKIYLIEDSAPNAFATGRDPEHGVICFTTGLLRKLEKTELEGVIAHELSHIGNRDILLSTVIVVLVGFVTLLADWFRHVGLLGRRSDERVGGWPAIIVILLSVLAPLGAMLMQLAISRKREFLADASGALLTRYPDGLARALEKISADTEPLEAANRATAHLYIANPFKGKKMLSLFMTHPPITERVAALRGMKI